MATIQDIRKEVAKVAASQTSRSINEIKTIVRHHSAGPSGDFWQFWNYWKSKGWTKGGYHEIILRDGTVQLCYEPIYPTNGVGNQNKYTYHICLVGNGNFTAAQEKAFIERCLLAQQRFKVSNHNVKGHNEMPGANTACPGINMHLVRNRLLNAAKAPRDYLQVGDKGKLVGELQTDLTKLGYKLTIDEIYGPATEKAVEDFQGKNGLSVDGIAGPKTFSTLAKALEPKKEEVKPVENEKKKDEVHSSIREEFEAAIKDKITTGERPNENSTRAEAAVMVYRAQENVKKFVAEEVKRLSREASK